MTAPINRRTTVSGLINEYRRARLTIAGNPAQQGCTRVMAPHTGLFSR